MEAAKEQIEQQRQELERVRAAQGNRSGATAQDSHDSSYRLQQLQTQYDILVSQVAAKGQMYKNVEEQIEESNTKVRDLRRALEELRHEKEAVDIKAERADELESAMQELRRANRALEDKIARLCEAPFISDAFGQQESRLRFEDVAKEREEYLSKVNHLQEAVRTHYSALTSLKQHAAQLREEKENAEKRAEDLQLKLKEVEAGSSMFQDKLRLYSGDGDVDIESLERALTLVKRRTEAIGKLPFLEDPDGDATLTVPALKRKLEEVQIMNLKLTEEVERFESMLKLQSGINRDLHKELEVVVHKRDADKKLHAKRADEAEALAKRRQDKIEVLEAQVRQLVYDVNKRVGGGRGGGALVVKPDKAPMEPSTKPMFEHEAVASDAGNALLNQLLEEGGGELSPDTNLLEVWVKGANVVGNAIPAGASTLAVVEFFDFNSQPTSLERGSKPKWDFAATYKLTLDDFLLRYFATDVCTIELHAVAQGDNTLLARSSIPLSALLRSKPCIILRQHPMISVRNGDVLAYLDVELRLALPISELYRLFLERHPNEKDLLKERAREMQIEATSAMDRAQQAVAHIAAANKEDETRLYNDLEISIIKATGLPLSKNGKKPAAYVHFQFLMFPDVITPAVSGTQDPVFNLRWNFAMITNDDKLRLLRRSSLLITVLDMNGEEISNDTSEGLIGELSIKLDQLSDGVNFCDTFAIKDSMGNRVADLEVGMRWKHTFRTARDLGPRALSAVEVETLVANFSADEASEGTVVDYRAFCRFCDPPIEVRRVMDRMRVYAQRISETEGRSARDVFKVLFGEHVDVDPETFLNKMELTNLDLTSADFARLFSFVDMDENNLITLDQMLAVLNLDDIVPIPSGLNEKLRERARDLQSRGISTLHLFEMADQWGVNGLVTRMEFKQVLRKMGFQLVDDGDSDNQMIEKFADLKSDRFRGQNVDDHANVLNDTLGSNDDVLIAAGEDLDDAGRAVGAARYAGADAKNQRAQFDQRTQEAAALRVKTLEAAAVQRNQATTTAPVVTGKLEGKNLLNTAVTKPQTSEQKAADPYGADSGRHQSGVTTAGSRAPTAAGLDKAQLDASATAMQKVVRGHQTRSDNVEAVGGSAPVKIDNARPGTAETSNIAADKSVVDIVNAEATIRACLAELRGVAPEPNFIAGFERVDTKRNGYVNRTQFAHVMKQYEVIKLHGTELRACMDFFDASENKDGSKIMYEAFAALLRYREPSMLQSVQRLHAMVLGPDAAAKMRAYDGTGTGHIKRADMLRVLSALGFEHLGAAPTLAMLELFETKEEGRVNYGNFVECVRELPLSKELDRAASEMFQRVTGMSVTTYLGDPRAKIDEAKARVVFGQIDAQRRGKFSKVQLSQYLTQEEMRVVPAVVAPLLAQMDNSGRGEVNLHDFVSWIKNLPHATQLAGTMYSTPSLAEIQKKANAYMLAVAKSATTGTTSPSLEEIACSFSVYDWTHPPAFSIGRGLFFHACKRAGFCFSVGELRTLASEFSSDSSGRVKYRKFLGWATPESGSDAVAKLDAKESRPSQGHPPATLIRFLEKKLQSGTDLLTIFGRYDKQGAGRVTADECCAVFSELGLSTVSQKEALEMADRYSAAVQGYVMYRRVIQDVLRQLDDATDAGAIDVVDTVRAAMQRSRVELRRLRDIFELYDRRSTGKVDEKDLGTIFEEARVQLKRRELEAVGDKYCVSGGAYGSGLVSYGPLLSALEARLGETATAAGHVSNVVGTDFANKMRDMFEELVMKGKDFYAEFSRQDEFSGTLIQSQFREVLLERLRAPLTARDMDVLETNYRAAGNARMVNYSRIIRDFHPRFFSQGVARSGEDAYTHSEILRNKIRRRCDYLTPGQLRKLYPTFKRRKESFGVSLADLSAAMRGLQMVVAPDHEREIFDAINLSGGNEFQYTDFCVFVKDPMHLDVVWKLHKLMNKNRIGDAELTAELNKHDPHRTGAVSIADFERVLKFCNIDMSASDISRLVIQFDLDETQRVDIQRFTQFLRGQAAIPQEGSLSKRDERDGESAAWASLRLRVLDKLDLGYTENEVFALFDPERRGALDVAGLQHGSRAVNSELSRAEARAVVRRMMQLVTGELDRARFYEALQIDLKTDVKRQDKRQKEERRESARDEDVSGGSASGLYGSIKEKVRKQKDVQDGVTSAEDMFRRILERYAVEKSGKLTSSEIKNALETLNCPPTKRELMKLEQDLDPEFHNIISINDFVEAVYPGSGRKSARDNASDRDRERRSSPNAAAIFARRPDLAEAIVRQLSDKDRVSDLLKECQKADRYAAGNLERGEFAKVLARVDINLSRAVERDLVDTFGENAAGIDYRDFADACLAELQKGNATDDVIIRLQKRAATDMRQGASVQDAFRAADRSGSGELDIDDVENALGKLGLTISREESKRIVQKFSVRGTTIKYKSLLNVIVPQDMSASDDRVSASTLVDRLKRKLEERLGSKANAQRELKESFADMDRDRSGSIDQSEFQQALNILRLDFTKEEITVIFKRYADNDRNGELNYSDFLRMIDFVGSSATIQRSGRPGPPSRAIENIADDIRRRVEDYLGTGANAAARIKDMFADIDTDGNGTIDKREFSTVMRKLRVDLTSSEIDELFEYYDAERAQRLDYNDFIRLLAFETSKDRAQRLRSGEEKY